MILSCRQKNILISLTTYYLEFGIPVSSRHISTHCSENVSPATIRAEMLWLENNGYLYQPHTSAGRIPTDKALRFYVDKSTDKAPCSNPDTLNICKDYSATTTSFGQLLNMTADYVSDLLGCTTLVTSPDYDEVYFSGTAKLVDYPGFNNLDKIKQVLQVIDEKTLLIQTIKQELKSCEILIRIGSESTLPRLQDCTTIAVNYDISHQPAGIFGVLASKQIPYRHFQTTINTVAQQIGTWADEINVSY